MELYLQSVVVDKKVGFPEAQKIARDIIKGKKKTYFQEIDDGYKFRNIAGSHFKTLRSKRVNDNVTIIYGEMLDE